MLFETYTPPLLAYVRRSGYDSEGARDLMQSFFASLLERRDLRALDPDRGQFRAFLLAAVRHFLLNSLARERALKRGGQARHVSLDAETAAVDGAAVAGAVVDPADTPEQAFDRQWALTVIENALARVRRQWREAGKLAEYEQLNAHLTASAAGGYKRLARDLGTSEGAARVAVHRLRRRFRHALRDEILDTVDDPGDIDAEIAYLKRALASRAV